MDTKSAPVCGDPCSQCSLWKFKPDRNILWMLDNCSRSPLIDNICHYRQGLNSVSTLAVWWPAFESNLLPDSDLLNFFLFCWRHFLVCKMNRFQPKSMDLYLAFLQSPAILCPSFSCVSRLIHKTVFTPNPSLLLSTLRKVVPELCSGLDLQHTYPVRQRSPFRQRVLPTKYSHNVKNKWVLLASMPLAG